jgi:hypothetical protein
VVDVDRRHEVAGVIVANVKDARAPAGPLGLGGVPGEESLGRWPPEALGLLLVDLRERNSFARFWVRGPDGHACRVGDA